MPGAGLQTSGLFFSPALPGELGRADHFSGQGAEPSRPWQDCRSSSCTLLLPYSPPSGTDHLGGHCGEVGPPPPSTSCRACGHEDCPCFHVYRLVPEPASVFSWALFCSEYEAFSSPGRPDLGKWRNHVAKAPAGCQAHCLGLGPACCSQELRPAEEGPAAGQAGSARHARADAARQGSRPSGAVGRVSEMGRGAQRRRDEAS